MNKKVFIKQDGTIPGHRIKDFFEGIGAITVFDCFDDIGVYYTKYNNRVNYCSDSFNSVCYTELLYDKTTDSFYEKLPKDSVRYQVGEFKDAMWPDDMDKINKNLGSENSPILSNPLNTGKNPIELQEWKFDMIDGTLNALWNIPEGYEATIEDGKVIVKRKKWQPKEGDKIYSPNYYFLEKQFYVMEGTVNIVDALDIDIFPTEKEAQTFCNKLNEAIAPIFEERRKEVEG